jgi:ribose/xylose/arabinose/galactoside ABC-type transport system permease subunit
MVIAVIIFMVIERRTLLGKYAVAVGSNPQAAFLAGVPIRKTRMTLYILSGLAAGWGGVMISSRLASGIPNAGLGFEFEVIVATVLGGTSLLGGQGTVIGMLIGALIVGTLNNGLNLLGVQSFWQTVALGTVLVLAVGLDAALRREGGRPRRLRLGRPATAPARRPGEHLLFAGRSWPPRANVARSGATAARLPPLGGDRAG